MTPKEEFDLKALFKEEGIKTDPKTLTPAEKKEIETLAKLAKEDEKKEQQIITKDDVGFVPEEVVEFQSTGDSINVTFNDRPEEPGIGVSKDSRFAPSPTPAHVPVPKETYIKEKPPLGPNFTIVDHDQIAAAADGRLESDIPLTDDYWKVKNEVILRSRAV
jgi:hypothetical protein